MTERKVTFTCKYCGLENTIIVKEEKPLPAQSKPVFIPRYCEHCHKPNKLSIPDNIVGHIFILGKDPGFLGYTTEGIPHLQGEAYP